MANRKFVKESRFPVSAEKLFRWHTSMGAFGRLQPPWETVTIEDFPDKLEKDALACFRIRKGPVCMRWVARHSGVVEGSEFTDTQESGPFAFWKHRHRMIPEGEGSVLRDEIEYRLPMGKPGQWVAGRKVKRDLERMFEWRHRVLREDLERGSGDLPGAGRIILITGRSGLIGNSLASYLQTRGYEIRGLSRQPCQPGEFSWNPVEGTADWKAFEGAHAVVHLAGESILGRWTKQKKDRILRSRVAGTQLVTEGIRRANVPVLVSASGVNFYSPGPPPKEEGDAPGPGFLAEVCREWEKAAKAAEGFGTRVVLMRTGVVLTPTGGALKRMLPAFWMGLGGPLGKGQQAFPWIALNDLLDRYTVALEDPRWSGPINAVAPMETDPVSHGDFAKRLGAVLRRPAFLPVPTPALRILFGQMADEALLADIQVRPHSEAPLGSRYEDLEDCLRACLGRPV